MTPRIFTGCALFLLQAIAFLLGRSIEAKHSAEAQRRATEQVYIAIERADAAEAAFVNCVRRNRLGPPEVEK